MQELIRNKWAATPSSSSSSSQVGGNLFTNRALLAEAITGALREKFFLLSEPEIVYRRVAELAGHPSEDSAWGKEHAEENIIRLIDAMAFIIS